jgi:hypothetical protein
MKRQNFSSRRVGMVFAPIASLCLAGLFGCPHPATVKPVQPAVVPTIAPTESRAPNTAPPVPVPVETVDPSAATHAASVPEPHSSDMPEGYWKNFGGWAAMVDCASRKDCAKAPPETPPHLEIAFYKTTRDGAGPVDAGETVHIRSRIAIVGGRDRQAADVMEGIVISSRAGDSGRLLKGVNPYGGAGEFETDFQLEIPKTAPPGHYTAKTTLFRARQPVDTHIIVFEVRRRKN